MTRLFVPLFILLTACDAHQEATRPSESTSSGGGAAEVPPIDEIQGGPLAEVGEAEIPEATEAEPEQPPSDLPVDQPTPRMLYDQCHARLEGAQQEGECSVDADCGTAGCSQEVCVPTSKKGDIMTTCEILPCFNAVELCGCHEGQCTWSVKESMELMLPRIPIQVH